MLTGFERCDLIRLLNPSFFYQNQDQIGKSEMQAFFGSFGLLCQNLKRNQFRKVQGIQRG